MNVKNDHGLLERIKEPGFDVDSLTIKNKMRLVRESNGVLSGLLEGAKIYGDLNLRRCSSLTYLPEGLEVGKNLVLGRCTALIKLPEGLKIGGLLDLEMCESLKELPKGLEVGTNLYLWGCPAEIPNDAIIGGRIIHD